MRACKNAFGPCSQDTPFPTQTWWDKECLDARKDLRLLLRKSRGATDEVEYDKVKQSRKRYRLLTKKKRRLYRHARLRDLTLLLKHDSRSFYKSFGANLKQCPITDMDAWRSHFNAVCNDPINQDVDRRESAYSVKALFLRTNGGPTKLAANLSKRVADAKVLNTDFTVEEVTETLVSLSDHKAADPIHLTSELFKYAVLMSEGTVTTKHLECRDNLIAPALTACFNKLLRTGTYPSVMSLNDLYPVLKKGDPACMHNYRGIAVSSVFAKIYSAVWERRLTHWADLNKLRSETQFGFRKEVGTLHNLYVLRHLIDKHRGRRVHGVHGDLLFVCFIDFEKAFDSVSRELLLARLEERGVHGDALLAIKAMFASVCMRVKSGAARSATFQTTQGVKQGDPLSPLIFGLFIETLQEFLAHRHPDCGVEVMGAAILSLLYADDITLIAKSAAEHA